MCDTVTILDEVYYTTQGVLKLLCISKNTLDRDIRDRRITVFHHPMGNLFSREACEAWALNRTTRARK